MVPSRKVLIREADGMHCEIEPEVREPDRRTPGGQNWPESRFRLSASLDLRRKTEQVAFLLF